MEVELIVYYIMNGFNEFYVFGILCYWSIVECFDWIVVLMLVIVGEFDEATPATWAPYVERIADTRSHVFADASHCSHLEKPEEFRAVIGAFLAEHDPAPAQV